MIYRKLGTTGLSVSPIAFGAFKIGRNQKIKYAQGYELPDDHAVNTLLNGVLDLGINVVDTAPAYGLSEERIGRHIGHRRDQYVLSTKVGESFENGQSTYDFSAVGITASIHRSLRRLRCHVLDLVFVHSDGRDLEILNHTDTVPTLLQLRQSGLIRFLGFSGKTVDGASAALDWIDVLMVEYHTLDRSHEQVMQQASAGGKGIFIKKPLASGHIPPQEAIPFALAQGHVGSLVIGGLNLEHIRQNLRLAV